MSQEYPRLHKQPLVLVLAEVRFSAVIRMAEDYLLTIQDRLRRIYPTLQQARRQHRSLARL